jgi:hypothetical protein
MFAVPLGDAPAGTHLVEILSAAAVEYIRRKAAEGLPLGGIASIDVYAMRGADRERVGTVELPKVGVLPEPLSVSIAPLGDVDPIAAVAGVVADAGVKAPSGSEGGLESVASFIQLTGPNEARLRSIGVDPASMSLQELVVGLMQAGGYDVHPAPTTFHSAGLSEADTYRASLAGRTSTIVVLTHKEGDYPEVEENQLAELAVAASQVRTDQLVLVTDKYGPYSMYDRERRTDKLVFVTRERLQSFVDSFGLG